MRAAFLRFVLRHRDALAVLYAQPLDAAEMRARKAALFARMRAEYAASTDVFAGRYDRFIGETLVRMDNIRRIRIATKGPAVMPQKILTDHDWLDAVTWVVDLGRKLHKEVVIHTHFNHPNEITEISQRACDLLMERGITVRNLEHKSLIADVEFGEAFELFFIALFVFAGANLHVHELVHVGPLALGLVAVRSLVKWGAVFAVGTAFRQPVAQAGTTGLLLIPMAGLAIGLVNTTQNLFPQSAAMVSAIVLASVAIFETIGPPVAALAFKLAGEVGKATDRHG